VRKGGDKNNKGAYNNLENPNKTQISVVWQLNKPLSYLLDAAEKVVLKTCPFAVSGKELLARSTDAAYAWPLASRALRVRVSLITRAMPKLAPEH